MRTKNELYQEALRTVAARRQMARARAEDARAEAEAAVPALRHAEDEVRVRGLRCALAGASGKDRTEAAAALADARQKLTALLAENWPEMDFWDYSTIDVSRRCLTVRGTVRNESDDGPYSFTRCLCFDGEDLLVYKNLVNYTDHVADSIDVPDRVLSAAKDAVLSALDYRRGHTGAMGHVDGQWQQTGTQAEWDDWRIAELVLTDTVPAYPELGMRVYGLHYELHTTTPEDVMLAGGMYMDEDGWVGGLNTLPPVLVFHITPDGEYVLLQSSIPNDGAVTTPCSPDSWPRRPWKTACWPRLRCGRWIFTTCSTTIAACF